MKVAKLKLEKEALEFLDNQGYKDLFPPQKTAIDAGLLKGKNLLVSAPSGGKRSLYPWLSRNSRASFSSFSFATFMMIIRYRVSINILMLNLLCYSDPVLTQILQTRRAFFL